MQEKIIDFAHFSSIKIGGQKLVKIAQSADEALNLAQNHYILGGANNVLLSPDSRDFFALGSEFDYILERENYIEIGGATKSKRAFLFFKERDFGGLEFLSALPGTIGGLVKMNAGMKNLEIKNALCEICVNGVWRGVGEFRFAYRDSGILGVILAARFLKKPPFSANLAESAKEMRKNQPKKPSCGSCFKNPPTIPAGKLLENLGLKGQRIGAMGFSEIHANFLVNLGGGRFKDAIALIDLAKERAQNAANIALECEIVIL